MAQAMNIPRILRWLLASLLALLSAFSVPLAQYQEAPMLSARVEQGELPPVEERLPAEPLVLEPLEAVGSYGGNWRSTVRGATDAPWFAYTIGYERLVNWDSTGTEVAPNIAALAEANEDATEYTFQLREGMRWSDGEPFTADDILFAYNEVLLNREIYPGGPFSFFVASDGTPARLEKIDDYSFRFILSEPNGFFLQLLASPSYGMLTESPRHYLSQFHADFNEEVDALVQQEGLADWPSLFSARANVWQNAELPRLHPWVFTTNPQQATLQIVAERNPFYWKVDSEGNQLPYIDRVTFTILDDPEVMLLRALAGEIDLQSRHFNSNTNRPILFDNMESGNYRFFDTIPAGANTLAIALNLTHEDPVKREIFNNKDFRIGLSHAIDRQEIIDLVYVGQGEPWQVAPRPEALFFDEEFATQYTEFNLDLANEYLDRAGYSERDAQGYRLGPDGNRIIIFADVITQVQAWIDVLELVSNDWREVGIDMQVRPIERALFQVRIDANQHDMAAWAGDNGSTISAMLNPRLYMPFSATDTYGMMYAVPWARYFMTNGLEGTEPPAAQREQMALYNQLRTTPNLDEQVEFMRQILEITKDEFYLIGISLPQPGYGIVSNNLRNVPTSMSDAPAPSPSTGRPETFFFSNP